MIKDEKSDAVIKFILDPINQNESKDFFYRLVRCPGFEPDKFCLYISKHYLKRGRLPDFLHRFMLAYGIENPKSKCVKRYLTYKKVSHD